MRRLTLVITLWIAGSPGAWGAEPEGVPLRLAGVLVDQHGQPVADAEVYRLATRYMLTDEATPLVRVLSDENGRFAFDISDDLELRYERLASPSVVAFKKGFGIGGTRGTVEELTAEFRLELLPARSLVLQVMAPNKAGAVTGRVQVLTVSKPDGTSYVELGTRLAEQLSVELDDDGRATLDYVPDEAALTLILDTEQYGRQSHYVQREGDRLELELYDVGRVRGRLLAEDPAAVRNRELQIGPPLCAIAVRTDEQGRFEAPVIPEGNAYIRISDDGLWTSAPVNFTVKPQEETEVEVELVRSVSVRGSVVDDADDLPISGVMLRIGSQTITTDDKGRFEAYVPPSELTISVVGVPGLYLPPFDSYLLQRETIEPNSDGREFGPFRLKKGVALAGRVVNEHGMPVAGASVRATWPMRRGRFSTLGWRTARTYDDGRFIIGPVPKEGVIGLHAEAAGAATPDVIRVVEDERDVPLEIIARTDAVTVVEGSVTDWSGAPIEGARVGFRRAVQTPDGQVFGWNALPLAGRPQLVTDSRGRFVTPVPLAETRQYAITVEGDGLMKHESALPDLASADARVVLEPIVVHRERRVAGRVLDTNGQPLAGVRVWSSNIQPSSVQETTTDAEGRFALEHLHPNAHFVFAEKEDYPATGATISDAEPVEIWLDARDAPSEPLRRMETSIDEQRRWLLELLLPIYDALDKTGNYFPQEALTRLAPYAPELVVERLEQIEQPATRAHVLIALGEVEEALALASEITPADRRCQFVVSAEASVDDPQRRRSLLADAYLHARSIDEPASRIINATIVAKALWDTGFHEEAKTILHEQLPLARELGASGSDGYARGYLAESLALDDLEAARALLEPLTDSRQRARHLQAIAHEVAALDPSTAEQILSQIDDETSFTPPAVPACYRMAAVDLTLARQLADRLGGENKAYAYGVLAMGVHAKDPTQARQLLREAFDQLRDLQQLGWAQDRRFAVAFALLGFATTVDPQHSREYFWRTVALCPVTDDRSYDPASHVKFEQERRAKLALLLAIYGEYPDVQRELVEPLFTYWEEVEQPTTATFYRLNAVYLAMGLVDPVRACRWHTEFHPKVARDDRRVIPQPWMTLADAFKGGQPLHDRIVEDVFFLWTIDRED